MRFRPIRGLQRWLKRIRYNSAHNQRTPWQKAGDWWLLIALPCAFGVMLIGNQYPVKLTREAICTIRLGKVEQNAPLEAWMERDKDDPWAIGIPFGSVNVYTLELNYGWPLSTGSINKNYGFRLSTFNPDDNLKFPVLSPERYSQHPLVIDAVISTLRAERLGEVADEWLNDTKRNPTFMVAMFAQTILYWMVLFPLGLVALKVFKLFLRLVNRWKKKRTIKRIRSGLCPRCKYNLGDQQFPERCPECGQRIWG